MRRNVLIIGASGLLGTYLTAFRLRSSEDIIFHAVSQAEALSSDETMALLLQAVQRDAPEKASAIEERLHRLPCDFGLGIPGAFLSDVRIDEVWLLSESPHSAQLGSLLSALPQLGATEFNYVGAGEIADIEREVIEQCSASGISYRIFRTALIISENLPLRGHKREGFFRFLSALYDIKNEVEEHLPEYFEYQALRCWAPDDAGLNLMRADQAAEIMSRIAQRPDTFGNRYNVVSPESVSFADLCERVGMVYGLSLLTVDDRQSLNVIDRLFHERLNGFHAHFMPSGKIACEETYRAADFASEDVPLDEEPQVALFEAILGNQNAVRDARRERIADFPGSLEQKTINRGEFELTYYSGGSGEIPIILLNALGQGLHYWYRLIDNLMQRHRVIIWEPRGTVSPPPPFGIKDQVDDLEAVLENEAADTCYLIGWCTGPKVATEFYLRHPSAVLAMVFLNSTFRCLGGPEEYETDYEHNLEPLCRLLNRRPETAASVMKSLQAANSSDHINLLEESDPEQLATGVLSLINVDLKHEVLMPFRNESTMLNYSRQVLDFWSHNTLEHAPRVQTPVLIIGSEYDKSASPVMSRVAAELFPTARYVQLQGATHYCFYDRPDLITELIERFFHDPDALSGIDSEAKLIPSQADRQPLDDGLSDPLSQATSHKSMARLLRDLAVQSPSLIAIVDSNVKLTYQQLHQQASLLALHLRENGIRAEDVVGVFLPRSANQIVAMLGILKAGAACLPLDTSEPPLRLKSILQDSNPRLLITDYSLESHLQEPSADVLYIEDLQQLLEESQSTERHVEDAEFHSDNLALLLYQSSPIGRAEAVMLTHLSLSNLASVAQLQMLPSDKMSYTSSLWQPSWLLEVFAPLAAGAAVVVLPDSSSLPPRKFASLLRDSRITIWSTHSAALQRLTKEFPWAINSVRMFVCNDLPQDSPSLIAKLKADILQRVFICYEAVEAAGCWALHPLSLPATNISPQHLLTGRKLFLLDDSYEPVASDITGELYISTDAMARGYYRNPSRTAETFIPDPFASHTSARLYRTGELARSMPDGSIQPLGRQDWRIHHHGQMIHPQEIEAALLQHRSISQAAVVFKDGVMAAFIVAAQGQQPSSDELKRLLKQSIPEAMLPSSFTFQEDLPRTPDGKLDRKALVSLEVDTIGQTAKPAVSHEAPSNDIERQLAQIWMEIFEGQEPGINDNFFELGAHSLLATQVVARISDMFKLHLPLKQVFETPTIAGLAKVIQQLSLAQGTQDGNNEGKDKPHTILQAKIEKQEDEEAAERPGSCSAH